jgi:LmbE family N-acetylglucosaminyl deacetylase
MRRVLWLFAHQDDEVAAAARILEARDRGNEVWCAFLTDGALFVPATVRNPESLRALARLGVAAEHVLFFDAPDGQLLDHLDRALDWLESRVDGVAFDEVGCLAFEGGHQDHDASHLVALAFARRRGIDAWEVPLYNGLGWRPFRVMRCLGGGWETHRISVGRALKIASLVTAYPSQRKTWLGLFPETFLRLVILRRVFSRRAEPARVFERPHAGALLYERRFNCPYDRFARAALPFAARHFPRT